MSTPELSGRIAVVTGAGSGIGRSTAMLLGRLGATVHAADIDLESARAVADQIGSAQAHQVDCADPQSVESLAERVYAAGGRVDILHNNAGIGHAGDIAETTVEDWQRVIGVNLLGVAYCIEAFVPRMIAQGGGGSIVNTASLAGLIGIPQMAPYCASKFGVVGLSEALDSELRPHGIRVSAICPGIIDTPIVQTSILRGEAVGRREEVAEVYRKRGASPEQVAETVVAAVRRQRLVAPVPAAQVRAIWLLKRVSPRAAQGLVRLVTRITR